MGQISKWLTFVLLIMFCLVGMFLIRIGMVSYEENLAQSNVQADIRTPMGYISHKIKAQDKTMPIEVRNKEGVDILVLQSKEEDTTYETWIYALDHHLYEAYVEEGSTIDLDAGFDLMEIGTLEFALDEASLRVKVTTKEQTQYELLFAR